MPAEYAVQIFPVLESKVKWPENKEKLTRMPSSNIECQMLKQTSAADILTLAG